MTALFDFVEDPVARYICGGGGIENSVLCVLHRLRPRIQPTEACVTSGRSQKRGGDCTDWVYIYITSTAPWKPAFMATLVE